MLCPYCGKEMTPGNLTGDPRCPVRFRQEGQKLTFGDALCGIGSVEAAQYKIGSFHIPCHYCSRCKKLIIETEITK